VAGTDLQPLGGFSRY